MADIFSMTGFGAAQVESGGLVARVEIKAVNHRGLKLNVKSRPSLGSLEKNIRDIVSASFKRGAVDVFVNVTRPVDEEHPPIQEDLARGMVGGLRRLAEKLGIDGELAARDLLAIPGLFDNGMYETVTEQEFPPVEEAARKAVEQALGMRRTEGAATAGALAELIAPLESFKDDARRFAPEVVERARVKLKEKLDEICGDNLRSVDEQSLEREVCFFADRADINEELDRLTSHISQFKNLLEKGGEIGKRLEFIAQEFLREVNTTASKANDTAITGRAVEAKLAVEKIKEQAANLE